MLETKIFSPKTLFLNISLSLGIGFLFKRGPFLSTWLFTVFIIFIILMGATLSWEWGKQVPTGLRLSKSNSKHHFNIALLVVFIFIALSLLMAKIWPWGADYYYYFYPLAEQWLNGYRSIYDGINSNLFYPPWSLFVIVPLAFLPIELAHGFQMMISVVLILVALRIQHAKTLRFQYIFLSLINLHSFDVFYRGQLDAIILFGVVLGFWAIRRREPLWLSLAFCLMTMKPPLNVLLIFALYLISIRHWKKREILLSFTAPFIMVLTSSLAVGLDWPIDYIRHLTPPYTFFSISIWKGLDQFGFPYWPIFIIAFFGVLYFFRIAWKENLNYRTLSIAISVTLIFIPYANSDHYVLLLPAFIFVLENLPYIGILAYITTWVPLLTAWWGPDARYISIIYPIILLSSSYMITHYEKRLPETEENSLLTSSSFSSQQ